MPNLTPEETQDDRPVCSLCELTFLRAHDIQVHRPCRRRKLEHYAKPNGLFAVVDGLVMLTSVVGRYNRGRR